MPLSGAVWPAHPKPQPDELLSSWLERAARQNAPKVHSFCHAIWPGKQIWTRDIDKSVDAEVLTVLAESTATDIRVANSTSLRAFEGVLYPRLEVNRHMPWILPVGVYHRTRTRYGLQWCPECLKSDAVPYFRKKWRLSLTTCCAKHGVLLIDRCSDCGSPAVPHRGPSMRCHICQLAYAESRSAAAASIALQFEWRLSRQIDRGWTSLDGKTHIHPVAYFDVLRQLVRVLTAGQRGAALRSAVLRRWPTIEETPFKEGDKRAFEYMSVRERHYVMQLLHGLLDGWPFGLVGACMESRNWASWVLKDMTRCGYHLWEPAKHYLSRSGMRAKERSS